MAPLLRRGIVSPSNAELLQNTIGFVIPSILLFILRIVNATWVLRTMHIEDYLMCVAMCFYITLLILINVSARYATNLFPPEQLQSIMANPQDVADRIKGSIIVIPLEQCMLASTWAVKICIWLFLWRLCRQLPNFQRALRFLMAYIIVGYFSIMIVYYGLVCKPFSQYWAVPVKNEQCATYSHYSLVQMVFNISSDIGLILIPLRMFAVARLPLRRKAILMVVFSLAIFTILAAILNKVYNFKSPMTTVYQLWYIRESSVAIWVGNLICCWQITQKIFKTRSFDNKSPEIVFQPEMAARLAHPSNYTAGGSPKPKNWFEVAVNMRRAAGNFLSVATTKLYGPRSSDDQLPMNEIKREGPSAANTATPGAQTPISSTLEKALEGGAGPDDISPALQYRESQHIG